MGFTFKASTCKGDTGQVFEALTSTCAEGMTGTRWLDRSNEGMCGLFCEDRIPHMCWRPVLSDLLYMDACVVADEPNSVDRLRSLEEHLGRVQEEMNEVDGSYEVPSGGEIVALIMRGCVLFAYIGPARAHCVEGHDVVQHTPELSLLNAYRSMGIELDPNQNEQLASQITQWCGADWGDSQHVSVIRKLSVGQRWVLSVCAPDSPLLCPQVFELLASTSSCEDATSQIKEMAPLLLDDLSQRISWDIAVLDVVRTGDSPEVDPHVFWGDLRSSIHQKKWSEVVIVLDRVCERSDLLRQGVEYALGFVLDWEGVRETPLHWLMAPMHDPQQGYALRLCNALSLGRLNTRLTPEQSHTLFQCPHLLNITSIGCLGDRSDALVSALAQWSGLPHLNTISLDALSWGTSEQPLIDSPLTPQHIKDALVEARRASKEHSDREMAKRR